LYEIFYVSPSKNVQDLFSRGPLEQRKIPMLSSLITNVYVTTFEDWIQIISGGNQQIVTFTTSAFLIVSDIFWNANKTTLLLPYLHKNNRKMYSWRNALKTLLHTNCFLSIYLWYYITEPRSEKVNEPRRSIPGFFSSNNYILPWWIQCKTRNYPHSFF
jgi:hypothetical protein